MVNLSTVFRISCFIPTPSILIPHLFSFSYCQTPPFPLPSNTCLLLNAPSEICTPTSTPDSSFSRSSPTANNCFCGFGSDVCDKKFQGYILKWLYSQRQFHIPLFIHSPRFLNSCLPGAVLEWRRSGETKQASPHPHKCSVLLRNQKTNTQMQD